MAETPFLRVKMDLTKVRASAHKFTWLSVNPEFATIDEFRIHVCNTFSLPSNTQLYVEGGHLPENETVNLLRQNDVVQARYFIQDVVSTPENNIVDIIENQPIRDPDSTESSTKKKRKAEFLNGETQPIEAIHDLVAEPEFSDSSTSKKKSKKRKREANSRKVLDQESSDVANGSSFLEEASPAMETFAEEPFPIEENVPVGHRRRRRRRSHKKQKTSTMTIANEKSTNEKNLMIPDLASLKIPFESPLIIEENKIKEEPLEQDSVSNPKEMTTIVPSMPIMSDKFSVANLYDNCKPINALPPVGTNLAFKIIELSELYCPEVSEYKEGVISEIEEGTDVVTINLFNKEIRPARDGKFENVYPDQERQGQVIQKIQAKWVEIIEPKLLIPA